MSKIKQAIGITMLLVIVQDTTLKRSPFPSHMLPMFQKWALPAGETIPVAAYARSGNHYKITLGKDAEGNQIAHNGFNTWYAFVGHARIQEVRSEHKTTIDGKALIQHFEGLKLTAYQDAVGVWTIGYGTTAGVYPGMTIDATEAERLLDRDIEAVERSIRRLVEVNLTPAQFSALVSFAYNVGVGAFERSTLLELINAGMYQDAADQLLRWVKANDKPLPGLVRRRVAERSMFLGGDWHNAV